MYKNILHATDLSNDHFALCERAATIAHKLNANLYLLHVIELPNSLQIAQGLGFAEFDRPTEIKQDAEAVMAVLGEALNIPLTQQCVEIGSIKTQVLEKILTWQCDLLILGAHESILLPTFLENSAHTIPHLASCDVLILRP